MSGPSPEVPPYLSIACPLSSARRPRRSCTAASWQGNCAGSTSCWQCGHEPGWTVPCGAIEARRPQVAAARPLSSARRPRRSCTAASRQGNCAGSSFSCKSHREPAAGSAGMDLGGPCPAARLRHSVIRWQLRALAGSQDGQDKQHSGRGGLLAGTVPREHHQGRNRTRRNEARRRCGFGGPAGAGWPGLRV